MLALPAPAQARPGLRAQRTLVRAEYAQRKITWPGGELNPRPRLWYHARRHLLCQSNHKTQVIWKGRGGLLCYSPTVYFLFAFPLTGRCVVLARLLLHLLTELFHEFLDLLASTPTCCGAWSCALGTS
jgi:hypothetical protein